MMEESDPFLEMLSKKLYAGKISKDEYHHMRETHLEAQVDDERETYEFSPGDLSNMRERDRLHVMKQVRDGHMDIAQAMREAKRKTGSFKQRKETLKNSTERAPSISPASFRVPPPPPSPHSDLSTQQQNRIAVDRDSMLGSDLHVAVSTIVTATYNGVDGNVEDKPIYNNPSIDATLDYDNYDDDDSSDYDNTSTNGTALDNNSEDNDNDNDDSGGGGGGDHDDWDTAGMNRSARATLPEKDYGNSTDEEIEEQHEEQQQHEDDDDADKQQEEDQEQDQPPGQEQDQEHTQEHTQEHVHVQEHTQEHAQEQEQEHTQEQDQEHTQEQEHDIARATPQHIADNTIEKTRTTSPTNPPPSLLSQTVSAPPPPPTPTSQGPTSQVKAKRKKRKLPQTPNAKPFNVATTSPSTTPSASPLTTTLSQPKSNANKLPSSSLKQPQQQQQPQCSKHNNQCRNNHTVNRIKSPFHNYQHHRIYHHNLVLCGPSTAIMVGSITRKRTQLCLKMHTWRDRRKWKF
eukprot:m.197424 g.197424  ORF g.197424 m.197424 type:complete len:516 (+) comp32660_c3_seq1:279-1826(+)